MKIKTGSKTPLKLNTQSARESQIESVNAFLENFPLTATSWIDATGEIVDIARQIEESVSTKISDIKPANPAEFNTKYVNYIKSTISALNDDDLNFLFNKYNHWFTKNLNESEAENDSAVAVYQEFMLDKNRHFTIGDGFIMEILDLKSKLNSSTALIWHFNKTQNVDDFVASVAEKLAVHNVELSDTDRNRLIAHYNKFR